MSGSVDGGQAELGLRERGKADKRARILAAATRALADDGYDAMTMSRVAREAGVAEGTVFSYAATKAELLMMVTAERWAAAAREQADAEHSDARPEDAIRAVMAPVVAEAIADPGNSAAIARELLFGAEGPHRSEVLTIIGAAETAIAAHIVRLGASDDRAAIAARMIVSGVLLEANRTRRHTADADSLEARVHEVVSITLAGALRG